MLPAPKTKPEELAEFMHNAYEESARRQGWKTQKSCQVLFKDLPESNKETMIEVAGEVLTKFENEKQQEIRARRARHVEEQKKLKEEMKECGECIDNIELESDELQETCYHEFELRELLGRISEDDALLGEKPGKG